jgi:fluoroquinolone transport system permease protein
LLRTDLKLIGRDRFILGIVVFILSVALIVRFVLPPLSDGLLQGRGFDLSPYFPLITSYIAVFVGVQLGGIVFGFTLLEAREDGTLRAVLASPLPIATYLAYRTSAPIVLGCFVIPAMAVIVGVAVPGVVALLGVAVVGSISGAIWALFVATFADNKVHAFALMKIVGGAGPILIGAYFLREPWQYVAGFVPPFWAMKAFWVAEAGGSWWWVHLVVGTAVSAMVLALLLRRFRRVAYR